MTSNINPFLRGIAVASAYGFVVTLANAADVILTGSSAINGMNTNYALTSPDMLILDITGVGGNRSADSLGAAIAQSGGNLNISGNGTLRVTGSSGDVLGIADVLGRSINISLDSGGLIDIQGGAFVNGGWGGGNWSANLADMNIASGAVFDVWDGGAIRVDALTGAGSVQNGSNNGSLRSFTVGVDGGSGTFSGVIGGGTGRAGNNQISLTKEGPGTQVLTSANSYVGATTVNGGKLELRHDYATSSFKIASDAVLEINGGWDGATTSFSGAGTLRKTGNGTLIWGSGAATFAFESGSLIDVQEGAITAGSWANENWSANRSNLNVAEGASFNTVEANVRVNKITGSGTIGTGYSGAGYANLTIGVDNGSSTFSGVIQNTENNSSFVGNLVKEGSGTITLEGNNTYTGTTTLNGGTLAFSGNNSLTGQVTLNGGSLVFSGGTSTVNGGLTYPHVFVNGGDLTFNGSAIVNISGALNLSSVFHIAQITIGDYANVTVQGGIQVGGWGNGFYFNGGTLTTPSIVGSQIAPWATDRWMHLDGTRLVPTGDNANFLTIGRTAFDSVGDNAVYLGGTNGAIFDTAGHRIGVPVNLVNDFGNHGKLTKLGAGTLTLSGANSYSGNTIVEVGELNVSATGSLRFYPGASGSTNSVSTFEAASVSFLGTVNLDLNAANATNGNTWNLFNLTNYSGLQPAAVSSTLGSFTEVTPGTWELAVSGAKWVFTEADGSLAYANTATPYQTWANQYGLSAGSEGEDLDNDGLTNFQEFAFGLIPNSGSSINPITSQLNKSNGQFSYQRLNGSGLNYTIWTSTDLVNWTEDTTAIQNVSTGSPNDSVQVTLSGDVPLIASKLFVRVKAQ